MSILTQYHVLKLSEQSNRFLTKEKREFHGHGGYSPIGFSSQFELRQMTDTENYPFLPKIDFALGTCYILSLPRQSVLNVNETENNYKVKVRNRHEQEATLSIPFINDLFYLKSQSVYIPEEYYPHPEVDSLKMSFYIFASVDDDHIYEHLIVKNAEDIMLKVLEEFYSSIEEYKMLEKSYVPKCLVSSFLNKRTMKKIISFNIPLTKVSGL